MTLKTYVLGVLDIIFGNFCNFVLFIDFSYFLNFYARFLPKKPHFKFRLGKLMELMSMEFLYGSKWVAWLIRTHF